MSIKDLLDNTVDAQKIAIIHQGNYSVEDKFCPKNIDDFNRLVKNYGPIIESHVRQVAMEYGYMVFYYQSHQDGGPWQEFGYIDLKEMKNYFRSTKIDEIIENTKQDIDPEL